MRKVIKVRIKKKIPTWNMFFDELSSYAKNKYGVVVQELGDSIFIRDIVSGVLYKRDIFDKWYEQYKDGINTYRYDFDVLLYYQTIQLFVNMFGKENETFS